MTEQLYSINEILAKYVDEVQKGIFSMPVGNNSIAIRDVISKQAARQGLQVMDIHQNVMSA